MIYRIPIQHDCHLDRPTMPADRISRPPKNRTRKETSNAQLLKKRETDRLAQRATRERTKHRIEQLEQEIQRLKSLDQNTVIRDLIETTEKQRRQNEELEGALFKILLIVRSACKSIERMRYPVQIALAVLTNVADSFPRALEAR